MHNYRKIAYSVFLAGLLVVGAMLAFDGLVAAQPEPTSATEISPMGSPAAPDHTEAVSRAMAYLESVQAANGSLGDEFTTIKGVLAAASARYPMDYLTSVSGTTALEYLAAQAYTYTHDVTGTLFPGRAGMMAVAAVAGNASPYDFGGVNLINALTGTYHAATGAYSTTAKQGFGSGAAGTVNQWWALLGLEAAQAPVPVTATHYLLGLQEDDGGWGYGFGGDVDVTAHVLQALLASGNVTPTHPKVQAGVDFLRAQQNAQGGWNAWSGPSPDSTAAVIQALVALGYTPATESWAVAPGQHPHTALVAFQAADGSFGGALGTAHAVAGLTETPLPIFGREQRARLALTWMQEQQSINGSWDGDVGHTIDAVLAYAAAGYDPDTVMATGSVTSAVDYLEANAAGYAGAGAQKAGKLALVAEIVGGDASNFGGVDLIDLLTNTYYSVTLQAFGVSTDTYQQVFPILGLTAANVPLPAGVTTTLATLQRADGGWKLDLGPSPFNLTGPDHTGIAMQALLAGGGKVSDPVMISATQYLADQQLEGGWGSWGTVNANSTAYAMQGLLAAGEDLGSAASAWRQDGRGPYDALTSFQKPDGPFVWACAPFGYTDNGLATWQAVPALLGVSYPFTPGALAPFDPVERGPDPDRLVTAAPRAALGDSVDLLVPFGSDLDQNAVVTVTWRLDGGVWQTATAHRADGYFTATIDEHAAGVYDVRAAFEDLDGLQGQSTVTTTDALTVYRALLPLVLRAYTP